MEALEDSAILNGRSLLSPTRSFGELKEDLDDLEKCRLLRQDTQGFYAITKKGRKIVEALKLGEK